jgi:hypothetical protein
MFALAALVVALAGPALLPDLDQAPPQGLSVVAHGHRLLLVFGSAVDNVGPGELVVEARRVGSVMRAWHVVGERRYPLRVPLRYAHSETHEHWHLPGFERYELRRARDFSLAGAGCTWKLQSWRTAWKSARLWRRCSTTAPT